MCGCDHLQGRSHTWGSVFCFLFLIWGLSDKQFRSFPVLARFVCILFLAIAHVMHSLNQEIKAFSRNNLRKQCTRVTTLTGKKIIETWKDARIHVVEEVEPSSGGSCGYVQDLSLDLHIGVIKPWLLLGEYIDLALTYWFLLDILLFRYPPPPGMCNILFYQLSCWKVEMFPFLDLELPLAGQRCFCPTIYPKKHRFS